MLPKDCSNVNLHGDSHICEIKQNLANYKKPIFQISYMKEKEYKASLFSISKGIYDTDNKLFGFITFELEINFI
jgi:hypothetical protein